ncbi:MAG: hypothetical protein UX72_C0008G0018 [Parcubacteria group bacterium GW2011_GWA2_47_10]|nr:MAG: hypothetical protein UX72_C0008G0018 [Parcubacteria group bacterium GW2011_GWA2_47_10]
MEVIFYRRRGKITIKICSKASYGFEDVLSKRFFYH